MRKLFLLHGLKVTFPKYFYTRKPCCRKETARCRSCSFWFRVRRQHSLQV